MRVLLSPPSEPGDTNPYLDLLSQAMTRQGATVRRYFPRAFLSRDFDVWHLHWPENVLLGHNKSTAAKLAARLLSRLAMAKARGIKIVWTCHNLKPHESHDRLISAAFWFTFNRLVDGVFSLSDSGRELLAKVNPELASKVVAVTPHGHYRGVYPAQVTRDQAREKLGFGPEERVALFFGQVRHYKNVPRLLECFAAVTDPKLRLLIAGACSDQALRRSIELAAQNDTRVQLSLSPIADAHVAQFMHAADLVVLPFTDVLNSGSVMLSLSFSRPVLAANAGALPELKSRVGDEWVQLFDEQLQPAHLSAALEWSVRPKSSAVCPLDAFEWDTIARQTIEGYRRVCRKH